MVPASCARVSVRFVLIWLAGFLACLSLIGFWLNWQPEEPLKFFVYLLCATAGSVWRPASSRLKDTPPISFVFLMLSIIELGMGEVLAIGLATAMVKELPPQRTTPSRPMAALRIVLALLSVLVGSAFFRSGWLPNQHAGGLFGLAMTGCLLYTLDTLPLAGIRAWSKRTPLFDNWGEYHVWSFPYYLAGTSLVILHHFSRELWTSHGAVVLIPPAFVLYCTYYAYKGRLSVDRTNLESVESLHLRTIEALAMAIEAKDVTSHDHLRRLQLYCLEIGGEMGMSQEDLEALRAAAVLHDIGKLAVPEHILCKRGKLSREEFEKIKIHPEVGAEILDRVKFPYPVAELVRAHHEKWNGGGYPKRLKGENIPLGARILAAVDCLDALISERTYRPAMGLEEAMGRIEAESGVSFDPRIVALLKRRYKQLESALRSQNGNEVAARRDLDAASEAPRRVASSAAAFSAKPAYLDSIAAARQEGQVMLELTQLLGNSLQLEDSFHGLHSGLKSILPFDGMVIYTYRDGQLTPRNGFGGCSLTQLTGPVPAGRGLVGWAVENGKPVLNGNPSVEMSAATPFQSAMVVPLPGTQGPIGVIMVCRKQARAFDKDSLRVVTSVSGKLGAVLENAMKYEQASASATTDFLTGLPNSRALHLQLESELSRAARNGTSLAVLVTDLDGFKLVNDRFGHQEGDAVLCAVSHHLRQACREYDYVARVGGDEFVLLLPGLAREDINHRISHFNQAASEAAGNVCPDSPISLSVGQAWYPEDGTGAATLLEIADQRMYRVKESRRRQLGEPRGYDFDWMEAAG